MRRILLAGLLACVGTVALMAADVAAGGAAYQSSCKTCHGVDGTANPAIANMMKVEIPDLKGPAVQGLPDDVLKSVITEGKGKMRPVKSVTGAAVGDVIAFVRSLKK